MKKLTLSMEESVIEDARRLAKEQGSSISEMFSRYVRALKAVEQGRGSAEKEISPTIRALTGLIPLPPLTERAVGLVKSPEGKTYRELVEEALLEKYGLDR